MIGYGIESSQLDKNWNRLLFKTLCGTYILATLLLLKKGAYAAFIFSLSGLLYQLMLLNHGVSDELKKKLKSALTYVQYGLNLYHLLKSSSYITKLKALIRTLPLFEGLYAPLLYGEFETRVNKKELQRPFLIEKLPSNHFLTVMEEIERYEGALSPFNRRIKGELLLLKGYYPLNRKENSMTLPSLEILSEKISWEILAMIENIYDEILRAPKRLEAEKALNFFKKGSTLSSAALLSEIPRLYCILCSEELSDQQRLLALLNRKQDEFLTHTFDEDYEKLPCFIALLSGWGTSQQINMARLHFGPEIGLNCEAAESDPSHDVNCFKLSRLLSYAEVSRVKREFYENFYTPEQLTLWVKEEFKFQSDEEALELLNRFEILDSPSDQ